MAKRKLPTDAELENWSLKFDLRGQRGLARAFEKQLESLHSTIQELTQQRRSPAMSLNQFADALGLRSYMTFKRRATASWDLRQAGPQTWTVDLPRLTVTDEERIERHFNLIRKRGREKAAARRARKLPD